MLKISVLGWILHFDSSRYIMCVYQELKAVLTVDAMVRVSALVLSMYHIPELVVLLPVHMVMGNSQWY